MKLTKVSVIAASAVLVFGACGGGGSANLNKSVQIAVELPFQGSDKAASDPILNGIRLAVKQAGGKVGDFTVTVAIPVGMTFAIGARVWIVNEVPLNSTAEQDFFKMKVAGTLSNNERPVTLVFPKVKITKGFQINFDEGNYTSMPFEFSPYFLSAAEISGRLSEIGTSQQGISYIA